MENQQGSWELMGKIVQPSILIPLIILMIHRDLWDSSQVPNIPYPRSPRENANIDFVGKCLGAYSPSQ